MHTEWVDLSVTGERMPAFVAWPDAAPRGGVIVLQEIFGIDAGIERLAELVAGDGYVALAPALFHRTDPAFHAPHDETGIAKGRAAAGALDFAQLVADLTASRDYLHERLGAHAKIGTWGFCFGGSVAYLSATLPFVDAAVSFYGAQIAVGSPHRPAIVDLTPQVRAPLLLAFGGRDAHITPAHVEFIREALSEHGKTFDLRVYADEDHGFFRDGPSGPSGSGGARDVWERVRAFFASHLAAPSPAAAGKNGR